MATIHPSRMAFIPHNERPSASDSRRRSPSPRRRRSPSPRSRSPGRRDDDRRRGSERDGRDSRRGDNYRSEGRGRSREQERSRDRDDPSRRRASPSYDEYKRPAPPNGGGNSNAPWRQESNMYPDRGDRRPYGDGVRGGADFLENRRMQRENMTANVWPPSPKAPARALSPKRSKPSKKSKRARSLSVSSDSSEEERRKRERKERKRARKEKDRERRGDKKRRHMSRTRERRSDSVDSEDDKRRERRRRSSPPRSRTPSRTRSPSPSRAPSEDEWVVKTSNPPPVSMNTGSSHAAAEPPAQAHHDELDDDMSDDEIGPTPLFKVNARMFDERNYGGQLLRGEGSAMAAFLQDGTESRIPRRGEIGLTSDEIADFEAQGYVMSGSRHRRMNAVRIRKENQVISAEEKRGILKLQKEEKARREAILREEFSELVNERLKGAPDPKPQ